MANYLILQTTECFKSSKTGQNLKHFCIQDSRIGLKNVLNKIDNSLHFFYCNISNNANTCKIVLVAMAQTSCPDANSDWRENKTPIEIE